MKKKVFTQPISVMLSVDMFNQLKAITDQRSIALSDYVREAIQEKLKTFNKNKIHKIHLRR